MVGVHEASPARPRTSSRLLVGVLVLLTANVAMLISVAHFGNFGRHILTLILLFAALAYWLRREASSLPLWAIVGVTAAVQLPGVFVHPLTSDDAYRYVWDGRVQLAGINPYRYVPLDPALAHLRDPVLFPADRMTRINRPSVPTIYPPFAQLWFAAVAFVTPWSWGTFGVQLGAGAAVTATTGMLARFLGDRRGWALLYGGCPAVMVEAANGAHLDAITALLVIGLGWCAVAHRFWLAGVFLGAAAGIKLVPLLLVPVFLRRGRWRTSLTALSVVIAGYIPHLLLVGGLVVGFLPGYWREEGYDGARRFALLLWLPEAWRTAVALIIAGLLAGYAFWRSRHEPVLVTCCWLYGCSFLVATPIYAWYALPFVVLVIMAGRLEWLSVWAATYVAFVFDREVFIQSCGYAAALLCVAAVGWRRHRGNKTAPQPVLDRSAQ
ncbi:MAG: hypothetical protein AVDCRST_MAG75-308 [uncultured Propionibacteriaceae bacterium]|uniref:DUF2029 domain-containing protein n=1 Tax=uncultured Propionibacteriaceae bacterium TaxID=257457 RepID=A0A6J4MZW3_9ACTN|nr:MAG: hypothetical protein AVDCRST_MAG75-308 [uncultured Propionibacteriaceae bacterium]